MIICGFPGTGKTTFARLTGKAVDLESTPFKKNWLLYAEVAKHMSDQGYTVMVSTHKEMLDALEQVEVRYTVIVPHPNDKDNYIARYDLRGNTYDFICQIKNKWDEWIDEIIQKESVLKTVVILPKDGCIQAWWKGEEG